MEKKNCKICGVEFEIKEGKNGRLIMKQIYCSRKCADKNYYNNNKEYYIENAMRWARENPEKQKEIQKKAMSKYIKTDKFKSSILKNYYNNKDKWNSRSATRKIMLGEGYVKFDILKKECAKCGGNENLEIHHEVYPKGVQEIKNAISGGKIYYLCRKCHGRKNNHFKITTKKPKSLKG